MGVGFGSGFALPTRTKPGPSAHLALAPVAEALWGPHARGEGRKGVDKGRAGKGREKRGRRAGGWCIIAAGGGARFLLLHQTYTKKFITC